MMKPMNPYERLKKRGHEILSNIVYCRRKTMLEMKAEPSMSYRLDNVYQRVIAAQQLGFEVVVLAEDNKLRLEYRPQRPETIPFDFQI